MKTWKLIVDRDPQEGSWNMAVDEFLFRSLEGTPQTYLRFYQWVRPTVSLGYSQSVSKAVDLEFCRRRGVGVVRRITGGKMVLHHDEVTYSLCSSDGELFTASLGESYRLISRALMRGLEKMGLKPILAGPAPDSYARSHMPCFAFPARDEVEIDGRKIVGSAQKRVGARFMQHGSIPLRHDEGLLKTVSCLADKESSVRMISLSQALGKEVSFDWAVEHLKEGFAEFFGIDLASKGFIPQELEAIRRIQEEKYGTARWNLEKSV